MDYPKVHRVLAGLLFLAIVVTGCVVLYSFGALFPTLGVLTVASLLWIGWELHRIATLANNIAMGFEDSYHERVRQEVEAEMKLSK